jgi:hypothetical protein
LGIIDGRVAERQGAEHLFISEATVNAEKFFDLENSFMNLRLQDKLVHWQTRDLWCSQIINDDNGLLCCFFISSRAFLSSDTIILMMQVCKAIGLVPAVWKA